MSGFIVTFCLPGLSGSQSSEKAVIRDSLATP
jgi:hypothetical protein